MTKAYLLEFHAFQPEYQQIFKQSIEFLRFLQLYQRNHDINNQFPMFRPPRPQVKKNNLFPNLNIISYGQSRQSAFDQINKITGNRPSSQETVNSRLRFIKKQIRDTQGSSNLEKFSTVLVSPNTLNIEDNSENQGQSINCSSFKIRSWANKPKTSKENIQPNFYTDKPSSIPFSKPNGPQFFQSTRIQSLCSASLRCLQLDISPLSPSSFLSLPTLLLNSLSRSSSFNISTFPVHFIISQSFLQNSPSQIAFLYELSRICTKIRQICPHSIIMTKFVNGRNCQIFMETYRKNWEDNEMGDKDEKMKGLKQLNYAAWGKGQGTINGYRLDGVKQFVWIGMNNTGFVDYYVGDGLKQIQGLYLAAMNEEKFDLFINSMKFQRKIINKEEQQTIIKYDKNSQVFDITESIYNNKAILQKIKLPQKQKKKSRSLSKLNSQPQPQIQSQPSQSPFPQSLKQKLVQYSKILYSETHPTTSSSSPYAVTASSSNFMKLSIPQSITEVMGQGGLISANTAYQFVGELLRNNGKNIQQIQTWREKYKGFKGTD